MRSVSLGVWSLCLRPTQWFRCNKIPFQENVSPLSRLETFKLSQHNYKVFTEQVTEQSIPVRLVRESSPEGKLVTVR